jgi:hypothetical protein
MLKKGLPLACKTRHYYAIDLGRVRANSSQNHQYRAVQHDEGYAFAEQAADLYLEQPAREARKWLMTVNMLSAAHRRIATDDQTCATRDWLTPPP